MYNMSLSIRGGGHQPGGRAHEPIDYGQRLALESAGVFCFSSRSFLHFLTKAVQFRRLPDMIRQLKDSESGDGGLSPFQTLALTLSSRVGVDSIAGVATAIAMGGPGAIM